LDNVTNLSVTRLGFNKDKTLALLADNQWLDAIGLSLGQERAQNAFGFFAQPQCRDQHLFMLGYPAIDSKALVKELYIVKTSSALILPCV